jgi:hypothetical protein
MDPVSIIVTAIVAGAAEALKGTATQAVKDGYNSLKALLKGKLSDQPNSEDIATAIQSVERKPEAPARQDVLKEELTTASADQDRELLQTAQALLELIQREAAAGQGSVVSGRDNTGNINTGEQINTGGGTYVRGRVSRAEVTSSVVTRTSPITTTAQKRRRKPPGCLSHPKAASCINCWTAISA